MKRASLFLLVCFALFVLPLSAQDESDSPTPTPLLNEQELIALATQVAENVQKAAQAAITSENALDRSFNLLGLFEIFGVVIGIGAVIAGLVGWNQLSELNKRVQEQSKELEGVKDLPDKTLQVHKDAEQAIGKVQQQLTAIEPLLKDLKDLEQTLSPLKLQLESGLEQLEHQIRGLDERSVNTISALSLLPLGEQQYLVQDLVGAQDTYQHAADLDPDNPLIRYRLGYVYMVMDKLEAAQTHFEHVLNIDPKFIWAEAALGYVHRRLGEHTIDNWEQTEHFNKAESLLLKALRSSVNLVDADRQSWWGALGSLYRRRGLYDKAIECYERASEVTPHSSYPLGNLASLYLTEHGNYAKMREIYQRSEKLARDRMLVEPENYWWYTDLLISRIALGKYQDAHDALESIIVTLPKDALHSLDSLMRAIHRLKAGFESLDRYDEGTKAQEFIKIIQQHYEEIQNEKQNATPSQKIL